ncbi:HET domain-containing protein [Pochonia chlamydosporia 170]|uniref:HET domain-containing protein n=1 Tax=Pochonia chlamydosporia 170 TaxID=1380566 RepID=A0A179FUS6_METCM|nr:HET domain-containing protein [Pochonia chlamydosporia 170]OAQ68823.1 HET domain-containing protein [Pochonia chlamydosporia 170]
MDRGRGPQPQSQSQPLDVDGLGAQIAQMLVPILTAQNSCQVHEQCDSSCPNRIGVKRYQLMPNGERRYETDERARLGEQLGHMRLNDGQPPRQQPYVIHPQTPRFAYTSLRSPHTMIRLVKLKSAYFRADPVDCELLTFDIDDLPPYGALSYCWGAAGEASKMICNGRLFYARPSLERSFKRLRAGFSSGQTEEYIWADALCINQADLEEKGAQIQLMERIYSYAATVYVDLGDTAGHVVSSGSMSATIGGAWGMGSPDTLNPVNEATPHPLLYKTVFLALRQPWFTRTWVIQEAALARRAVYMFSGNVFSQKQLDDVLSREAMRANPSRMQELMQLGGNDALRNYLNYTKLQQIRNGRGRMGSLEVMELTRDFVASDPADKVFGLFALMNEDDRRAIGSYPQTLEEVFRRFAALQVRRGFAIKMLDSAGLQRSYTQDRRLPSWVPDWTNQKKSPKQIAGLRPVPYAAAGFTEPQVRMMGDDSGSGGLSLRGLIVDTIDTVIHVHSAPLTPEGEPSFLAFHDKFRPAFDDYVRRVRGKPRYMDNEEVFARLLLMDDTYTGRNAILYSSPIENPALTYRSALAAWREGRNYRNGMGGGKMDAVQTFQMQAIAVCPGRGFATTRGEYIGLVPPVAEAGDLVVVFYGATVPYIIRRVANGYILIGDAFVHGFMCGEALERRDLEATDIVLV